MDIFQRMDEGFDALVLRCQAQAQPEI